MNSRYDHSPLLYYEMGPNVCVPMQVRAKTNVDYGSYSDVVQVTLSFERTTTTYTSPVTSIPHILSNGDIAAIAMATFAVLILVAVVSIIGGIKYTNLKKSHPIQ